MRSWHCHSELIWDNDFSYEDYGIEDRVGVVTVLHCSNEKCNAYIEIYKDDFNK